MPYFIFFLVTSLFLSMLSSKPLETLESFGWALLFSTIIISILKLIESRLISYLLFFSISFTSIFGITKVLTGSHSESSFLLLYGFSFYTTSLAFLHFKQKVSIVDAWKISNPLLLFTGPIAVFVKDISYKSTQQRISYYLPFIVVGIFYFQIVGSPLVQYMFLLNETDLVSAIVFATIFEIFVYSNFCGLSLIVYGLAGICGFKVPLNFRQPFSSTNLIDFWRGWHTSLSVVLKTLFYDQFRAKLGLFGALLVVYISSAMWHGITFNFLLWGVLHTIAFYLTVKILKTKIPFKQVLVFFLMVCAIIFGRMIFADNETSRLLEKLSFNFVDFSFIEGLLSVPRSSKLALILGVALIVIEFLFQNNRFLKKRNYKHLRLPLVQVILMFYFLLFVMYTGGDYAIYGQR